MIAPHQQRVRQAGEHALVIVAVGRGFTVQNLARLDYVAAVSFQNRLMAPEDADDG